MKPQPIDLNRVNRIARILNGEPADQSEKTWLFYFSLFTFVQDNGFRNLEEDEAGSKLKDFPDTECYVCSIPASTKPLPSILRGRKVKRETVEGAEGLSDLIFSITTIRIDPAELSKPQTENKTKDTRPVGVRVQEFIDHRKEVNELADRMRKNKNRI